MLIIHTQPRGNLLRNINSTCEIYSQVHYNRSCSNAHPVHGCITPRLRQQYIVRYQRQIAGEVTAYTKRCCAYYTRQRKYNRISNRPFKLNWLPIRYRIKFKIAMINYKVLTTIYPQYLRDLLVLKTNTHFLRSSSEYVLKVLETKLQTVGDRSFSFAAPKIWNNLPSYVKKAVSLTLFKNSSKHTFRLAYHFSFQAIYSAF